MIYTQVAILILLELTLQWFFKVGYISRYNRRNPYFIGINSAIIKEFPLCLYDSLSQSLFYWN